MPTLNPETLPAALARGLSPLYVIHGEELFLSLEAADAIRDAAQRQGYLEREVITVEGNFEWASLNAIVNGGSLFSQLKIVEIRIPGGKPGIEGADILSRLATKPPADTLTLVVFPKLDRQQQQSKWFQTLNATATIVHTHTIDRQRLATWVTQRLAKQQQSLSKEAMAFFIERVEGNVLAARQEIDKLALLCPSGELNLAQLQQLVANVARFDIFQLAEAWLAGEIARVLRIVHGLKAEGIAPVLVLWSLTEDIRMLIRLKQGQKDKRSLRELAKELRLWGEKQKRAERAVTRIGSRTLAEALHFCARIDGEIKGSIPGNPWHSLEKLACYLAESVKLPHTT